MLFVYFIFVIFVSILVVMGLEIESVYLVEKNN